MKAILIIKFNKIGTFIPETIKNINREEYQKLLQSTEKLCKKIAEGLQKDYFKKAHLDTNITYEIIDE